MDSSVIRRSEPLAQQVRDYIYENIISGTFVSTLTYSVSDMSQRLGVSRTPVREAVLQLEELGLVTIVRNKGFRVIEVSREDIVSAFQMRYLLEPLGAVRAAAGDLSGGLMENLEPLIEEMQKSGRTNDRQAFMNADRRFHEMILETTRNKRLTRAVNSARDATYAKGLSTHSPDRTWDQISQEHLLIADAIRAADPTGAAEAMRAHIRATGEHLLRRMGHDAPHGWLLTP